jgi:hypothetical protein
MNPHITNEDMGWSAPKYVKIVAKLVVDRLKRGRVEVFDGDAFVERFFALVKVSHSKD